MIDIQDFSNWNIYDGASEGSGRSEKIWLISEDGTIGLFKYPKIDPTTHQETTEHISEHLAHQLGCQLGVKTAEVDIGMYEGRIGSMSYLVCGSDEALIEGISFISGIWPHYNANSLMDEENGQYYCIDHIFQSTKKFMRKDTWIEMMMFDFLIGNADRHQSNWAILAAFADQQQQKIRIRKCPLYDNGSSLCCYVNKTQLNRMFGKDPGPFNALVDSKSRSIIRIDGSRKAYPKHREVVRFLLERYPVAHEIGNRFLDRLDINKIDELLSVYPADILDTRKNTLIRRFLQRKLDILRGLIEEGSQNVN